MPKVKGVEDGNGKRIGYQFLCPGCKSAHLIYTDYPGRDAWKFNGDIESPTFEPSLLIFGDDEELRKRKRETNWPFPINLRCHTVITAGKIHYQGDCEHELRGQTVEAVEWPYGACAS